MASRISYAYIAIFIVPQVILAGHLRYADNPIIKVIELRSTYPTKLETETIIDKPPNSNLVVGEDVQANSRLIFDCQAEYSVQWVYSGNGMPEYSTNTTQIGHKEGLTRPGNLSTAFLSLGFNKDLGPQDSGKYICRSTKNQKLASYYHLYIAGEESRLFTNPGGEPIYYRPSDVSVVIPCSVRNPDAAVTLQKSINGLVQCPLNQSIKYDASQGFELKISEYFDPAGTYICTGGYNGTYEVVRYTLIKDVEAVPITPAPITAPEQIRDQCHRNSDCSPSLACISHPKQRTYNCVSPCGAVCGQNTNCNVANHIPRCHCKPGFRGDPYQACYEAPMKIEQNPCNPSPCGQNTVCEQLGTVARCNCAPGFSGDPYVRCYKPVTRNPCEPNPCGQNSFCRFQNGYTSCSCRPGYYGTPPYCRAECEVNRDCTTDRACVFGRCRNPCEGACNAYPNTECRVIRQQAVCATINCRRGYYGRDCLSIYTKEDVKPKIPENLITSPEDDGNTLSASPCMPFPCGLNAECSVKSMENSVLNVTSDVALCQCPPNFTGNADIECYPISEDKSKNKDLSRNDELSPTTQNPAEIETTIAPSAIPEINFSCTPECGINSVCDVENKRCICQETYQGNAYIKCYPISCSNASDCDHPNASCVDGKCFEESNNTEENGEVGGKNCGINAISIVLEDGNSTKCICPHGFSGIPTLNCHPINPETNNSSSMEFNHTCTSPSEVCGRNTICSINAENNQSICECKNPFEGDPFVGCELNCTEHNKCPDNYLCHEQSNQCIDPCATENQPFFTQCGRDAVCKVENHIPSCHCPEERPHGNPHIHCKEKEWMPNHRVGNSTCQDEKRLKCGQNTSCKRFHDSTDYCVCLPGFFGDPLSDTGCKLGLQCRKNNQCRYEEECVNGRCLNACRVRSMCGTFAGCKAENHKANCICHIGTVVNPKGECEPAKGALAERLLFFRSFEDV